MLFIGGYRFSPLTVIAYFIRYQKFRLCLRKVFICLIKIRLDKKNKFVKTEGRQTSSSRAGALFLLKRNPDAERFSL